LLFVCCSNILKFLFRAGFALGIAAASFCGACGAKDIAESPTLGNAHKKSIQLMLNAFDRMM
jgi:hypothetical protein